MDLEAEREGIRALDESAIADAIETIGFSCTGCGACCTNQGDAHTATVFPDEIRTITRSTGRDWAEVARPMPFGLSDTDNGPAGETFEWALQTDNCGDCVFYNPETGRCEIYTDRPLICRTYPFRLSPFAEGDDPTVTESMHPFDVDMIQTHTCEGLGRDISREDAKILAQTLKKRALRERTEAIAVRDNYEPTSVDGVVVHDSEGQKHADGTPLERGR